MGRTRNAVNLDLVYVGSGCNSTNNLITARRYASAVYAVVVSVCVCVCLLHSGIVSKRLHVGLCNHISGMAEGLASNFVHRETISSLAKEMTNHP